MNHLGSLSRSRARRTIAAWAGLALFASPLGAQSPQLDPKAGVDPAVERLVRSAFPGAALQKASLHDFEQVALQTQLFQRVPRAAAMQDFRVLQEIAIPSHLGTRTRNDWFTLPVPAHPALTLFGSFGMPLPTEAQLTESEPNDRPWRANGMTCSDTMDGLVAPGDEDWLALVVLSTQMYDIAVNSGGNTDTRLTIYDQNLNRVAFNDDGGTIDPQIHMALPVGTYYLAIDGHDPANTTGTYRVQMNCTNVAQVSSAAQVGGVFAGQPVDTYRFNVPVDCVVSFLCDAAVGSGVNPVLSVTGPNGFDELLSNDDAFTPPSSYVQVHIPAGVHYVHVKDSSGAGGAYILTMAELARPVPNATLGVSVPLFRPDPFSARMVRFNNASFAEILARTARTHPNDVSAELVWCDAKLSTTEGCAKNLTGVNINDAEQLMGLPVATYYLLLRPVPSRLIYNTRNYARRLSSLTNHPGAFQGTAAGPSGFASNYVTPASTVRVRQRVNADWLATAGSFAWWFDQAVLYVRNSVSQTSVTANAQLMYQSTGNGHSFTIAGATPIGGGLVDTADTIGAACYWQNNTRQMFGIETSAVFEYPVIGALAGADSLVFETTSFLSGNDPTQAGATIPAAANLPTFTAVTDARWEIWNQTTGAWEQMTGAFAAVNGGTTWLNPTNIPFSESQGDFDATVLSTPRTITPMRQLGADYNAIQQPTIGQQHLFTYQNLARAMLRIQTTISTGTTVDPQAYIYDPTGLLTTWEDDRILGTLRDPDFFIGLDKGVHSIVLRSWDNCCTGSLNFVPRSRDFNITGNVQRGQQITMEVKSAPNALFAIYAAAGLLPIQIPLDSSGIKGDLVLDFVTLSLFFNGAVPGSGVFQLPLNIPQDPALANRSVFLQAVTIESLVGPTGVVSQEQRLLIL